ncbi:hypothetical protein [Companilactobacillus nodensis]|uniref:Uncharacterized protein n=1 Tax=Companilactobacillus nodensis DSM 19682 = JCM 14932 = NBRC 107160 TaxID=1423775 RepID=A0A0R1K9V6_9LACO|nr:hypothetical protein [Companilactobacillus nodensis]KRK80357.1 hypothetical protein FD03_GL001776 [Companilactobacillus nodensis DSM 19682 = JCM 14932 = NBRC 107160]
MLKLNDKDYTWFLFVLTLIFAAAKVFGFITWNWLWVFSPMLIALGLFILCYGTAGIVMLVKKHKAKKELRRMCKHD